ncbi:MAG: SAM-dependent methyltransferase [Vulcanimicrobiota bacterium]
MKPLREVYCQDALAWLELHGVLPDSSLVTSLPDFSEFPALSLEQWQDWFILAARRVLQSCPPQGVCIFFQSDVKHQGAWVDKGFLCQLAARESGLPLLWHKVVARVAPGTPTFGRPGYSHMLCFSPQLRPPLEYASPDILSERGRSSWSRGLGLEVCKFICRYLIKCTPTRRLVAPFCGQGLLLAVANQMGLEAVGIELSPKRARLARRIELTSVQP